MKRSFIISVFLFIGLFPKAQTQDLDVIYGNVRYDGFKKITKGAFWSTRPEAKKVYYGEYPENVEVFVLETDYYVRFTDAEHNNFDRNYIIFPKGQKIYKKNERYYAAICGNEIEFFRPVKKLVKVEDNTILPDVPEKKEVKQERFIFDAPVPEQKYSGTFTPDNKSQPTVKKKRKWWIAALVGAAATTVTYFLFKKGGGIKTPEVGGPGGAPPTTGYR